MITSTIGRIFLKAFNKKYNCNYDARTFFDEVYYKLFFDSNKYMHWVQNSPFVQMKQGQKVETLSPQERLEKLEELHKKIKEGAVDASVAIGYAASEEKEYATTSGQITDIPLSVSDDEVYLSWIGAGLGIGLQGGLSILFSDADILLHIYEGWKIYREALDSNTDLKGNQIATWNGQWTAHRYSDDYDEDRPMANFDPFETKKDIMSIKTQTWTKVLMKLSMTCSDFQKTGYVYNFGQTNTTVGFIPFILPEIRRPGQLYQKLFRMSREAEQLWGTEKGFRICCQSGAIGVKAMAPKGVMKYIKEGIIPKVKKDDDTQRITFNTYKIWILAMLNNDELWEKSQEFAKILHDYICEEAKKLSTKRTNQVNEVLKSVNKKNFMDALLAIVQDAGDKESIMGIAKEVNAISADNVPYFLTLIRLQYASIN